MSHEIEQLLSLIRSGPPGEVWEAAKALESLVIDVELALMQILGPECGRDSRAAAAYVLGHGRCACAQAALEDLLDNPEDDSSVRSYAAEALGYIQGKGSVEVLLRHLKDKSSDVRYSCIFALGQIGDPVALAALRNSAESAGDDAHEGHSLRAAALEAISEIERRRRMP